MDSTTITSITVSTHNVNGYSRSKNFLHSLCSQTPDSIRAIQEHWLRPSYKKQCGVNQLRHLHPDFDGFGTSAMNKSLDSQVRIGRPYGGTGFVYNKKFSKCIKPVLAYSHERVTVMELKTDEQRILMINAYMPYYNSRDLSTYLSLYRDTIGFIDNIMSQNLDCSFMLLADLNCNIYEPSHCYSKLVRALMEKHHLMSAFDLDPSFDVSSSFTRYDNKTNSRTLIDGILLSERLKDSVENIRISDYGDNVSDHLPVELNLRVSLSVSDIKKPQSRPYVNWGKLSEEELDCFEQNVTRNLNAIKIPSFAILHGNHVCLDDCHKLDIENYYENIVQAILSAESLLPKTNPSIHRSFWSEELSELKRASIECTDHWNLSGKPMSGPIFQCKKECHYRYKIALRKHKQADQKQQSDAMYDDLLNRNNNAFWKSWNSINRVGNSTASRIEGETDEKSISNVFAKYFESVYGGHDTPEHINLKNEFNDEFARYFTNHISDDIANTYLSWSDMIDIASKIKVGKATAGVVKPQHFIHGGPRLLQHFQILFNGMLQHGFVPTAFLKGTISPVVKDNNGDLSDTSNYRGITLGSLPSKLFEFAIQIKTSHLLTTDDLQFGFKRRTSTNHALYCLKTTVDHFVNHGSRVYVAFLDCSKAFDRISHNGLFTTLIKRGVPLCLLLCLIFWYSNMYSMVKWGSESSSSFPVPLGIKQGGINSPDFFSCYFDGMTKMLRSMKIGCHIGDIFLGSIFYADDIVLLAPTKSALQLMINRCEKYCSTYGLSFNAKKSKVMIFAKKSIDRSTIQPLKINGSNIDIVDQIKYLGALIVASPSFCYSHEEDLRSFYRAANSVLNRLQTPDESIQMRLLYTHCVPCFTYAAGTKDYSSRHMTDCTTALNDAIRKIFTFQRWESVRALREGFGYKSLVEIFARANNKFLNSLPSHYNCTISRLHTFNTNAMKSD